MVGFGVFGSVEVWLGMLLGSESMVDESEELSWDILSK